jgi:hypothetical protein
VSRRVVARLKGVDVRDFDVSSRGRAKVEMTSKHRAKRQKRTSTILAMLVLDCVLNLVFPPCGKSSRSFRSVLFCSSFLTCHTSYVPN